MPWHWSENEAGAGQWMEVSMSRYRFTMGFIFVFSTVLGLVTTAIRNKVGFGLLITAPILVTSVVVSLKISGRLWPDQPSQGPLEPSVP